MSNDSTKVYTVYRIKNTVTGKSYIGATSQTVKRRFGKHISRLRKGTHHNSEMQADSSSHGYFSFVVQTLETNIKKGDVSKTESHYINLFDTVANGYNADDRATGYETPCEWNGIKYKSIVQASNALCITPAALSSRLLKGYTCDNDLYRRRISPCEWEGTHYRSIAQAAQEHGLVPATLAYWIKQGYKRKDDIPKDKKRNKICHWNGVEYPSQAAAAKALGISRMAMSLRIKQGYTCDDDMSWNK